MNNNCCAPNFVRCLAALLALGAGGSAFALPPLPDIGGTPTATLTTEFTGTVAGGTSWQLFVHSLAFEGTAGVDSVPAGMPDPPAGQTLYTYVLRMSDDPVAYPQPVRLFAIEEVVPSVTTAMGFSTTIVPKVGMVPYAGVRQNPMGFSPGDDGEVGVYYYFGSKLLNPGSPEGEYSVLFLLAESPAGQVPAIAQGGTETDPIDTEAVLGPVPEPATALLLFVGGALLRRRTRAAA